jgi:hypothetical protein
MRFFVIIVTILLCLVSSAGEVASEPTQEFRIDFPYTDPTVQKFKSWVFEPAKKSADADLVEADVVSALASVVNTGQVTLVSVSVYISENGYIVGATAVTIDEPMLRASPVRLVVAHFDAASEGLSALPEFHGLIATWLDARKGGRTYEEFKVPRLREKGITTLVTYFCTAAPCPGKYPVAAI